MATETQQPTDTLPLGGKSTVPGLPTLTLGELNAKLAACAPAPSVYAGIFLQVGATHDKQGSGGKPYLELELVEGGGSFKLRVWDNLPGFGLARMLKAGDVGLFIGDWKRGEFGMDCKLQSVQRPSEEETREFFEGPKEWREKQARDWAALQGLVNSMEEKSPYTVIVRTFLTEREALFRRAAAAKGMHHARRGGLVEHVAYMARSANVLHGIYREIFPRLNRELMLAGVIFHDCGKMWENNYPEQGFGQETDFGASAMGHIAIGIQIVSNLWARVVTPRLNPDAQPIAERYRLALLHLILSHHGTNEWGSPVFPGMPEAWLLHMVDNIDAKLEMMRGALATPKLLSDDDWGAKVVERVRPLEANLLVLPMEPSPCGDGWWKAVQS